MAAEKKPDVIVEDGAVYVLRAGQKIFAKTAVVCALTGKSNQWIGQLVSQGAISKTDTAHGALFDLAATMQEYCRMLVDRSEPDEDPQTRKSEKEKLEAEVGIKKAKAIIALMEAKELQGKMHRSEDVAAMTEDLVYSIRGMLVALPGRLAVDTANATTAAEAAEIIREEVSRIMKEIASYRYDPKKYEERVRERQSWDAKSERDVDDG